MGYINRTSTWLAQTVLVLHYIVDYLAEEVLDRQPKQLHDFLLKTSILDQLSASLCNVITGDSAGEVLLGKIERANLCLIPMHTERHWFRYHTLFADVLRSRLLRIFPDLVKELHSRAAFWLEQNGFPNRATHHALVAEITSMPPG